MYSSEACTRKIPCIEKLFCIFADIIKKRVFSLKICHIHLIEWIKSFGINFLERGSLVLRLFWTCFNKCSFHSYNSMNFHVSSQSLVSFWFLYCWLWTYFTPCSSVPTVKFEQLNADWEPLKTAEHQRFSGVFRG